MILRKGEGRERGGGGGAVWRLGWCDEKNFQKKKKRKLAKSYSHLGIKKNKFKKMGPEMCILCFLEMSCNA